MAITNNIELYDYSKTDFVSPGVKFATNDVIYAKHHNYMYRNATIGSYLFYQMLADNSSLFGDVDLNIGASLTVSTTTTTALATAFTNLVANADYRIATLDRIGGIKNSEDVTSNTNRIYGIIVDSYGKAHTYVPWTKVSGDGFSSNSGLIYTLDCFDETDYDANTSYTLKGSLIVKLLEAKGSTYLQDNNSKKLNVGFSDTPVYFNNGVPLECQSPTPTLYYKIFTNKITDASTSMSDASSVVCSGLQWCEKIVITGSITDETTTRPHYILFRVGGKTDTSGWKIDNLIFNPLVDSGRWLGSSTAPTIVTYKLSDYSWVVFIQNGYADLSTTNITVTIFGSYSHS